MARSRKSGGKKLKNIIKFEVYGILIIVFSIMSLAGRGDVIPGIGSVGRSFSYIFLFLTGAHYYIIPLICIYVGLHVMIKRQWPIGWSLRKTGIFLILLALLTTYHISLFQQLDPDAQYSARDIITQPVENIRGMISQEISAEAFQRALGGGMIGALMYALLYVLFDNLGSKLFVVALYAIGLILLTGWSYVEMGRKVKQFAGRIGRQFGFKLKELIALVGRRTPAKNKRSPQAQPSSDERDDAEDVSDLAPAISERPEPVHPVHETPLIRDFEEHRAIEDKIEDKVELQIEPDHSDDHSETEQDEATPSGQLVETPTGLSYRKDANTHKKPYQLPPFHLLAKPKPAAKGNHSTDYMANAKKLEETLESFGVRARIVEVVRGPTVTRYEVQPDIGVKVSRIVSLTDDIALALAAKDIRMEAPIPGKAAIGIEVPNPTVSTVTLREVMESSAFLEATSKISIALGRDISGQPIVADLAKMPHLLVAGATGSGKSVCINGIIISILYKAKPDEVKFLMIDPKKVELNAYNGIPHLLAPVVTDPRRASLALRKVVGEMEQRYDLFSKTGTRNIEGYNEYVEKHGGEKLPFIIVIVDELADLMMVSANDVEDSIARLAQMARAAGIHLILATQRPSVNVITGVIKANIPSRIAFGVSSQVDSRTILDSAGAEKLLGRGDMLFLPVGATKPVRIQGAFLSDQEVEAVVQFAKGQAKAEYREELVPEVDETEEKREEEEDELYDQAVQIVVEARQASVSLLQRRMRIGYNRAARLIDAMEANGVVGPYEGSKPREVLITAEQYAQRKVGS